MTYKFHSPSLHEIARYSEPGVLVTLELREQTNTYIIALYTDFEGEIFSDSTDTLEDATAKFTQTIRNELAGRAESYEQALRVESV